MTWFRVDDGFFCHPKVVAMRDRPLYGDAMGLWAAAGSWSAFHLTDGFLPKSLVKTLGFRKKAADLLVSVGLWNEVKEGYQFHQWVERQPARAVVEQRRADQRERVERFRAKRRAEAVEAIDDVTRYNHVPERDGNAAPDPTRPDPIKRERESSAEPPAPARVPAHDHAREAQPPTPAPEPPLAPLAPLTPAPRLDAWSADRMALAFRAAYLARKQIEPSMAGKLVGDLHRRVCETARARGEDPAQLFARTLDRWLSRTHSKVERSAPYACFAQAFGELVDGESDQPVKSATIAQMEREVAECLRVVRGGKQSAS